MANPFHQLKRQRERMSAAARMASRYGATTLAEHYAIRLNGWATTCRAGDADWLAGMIGRNGIGPALDEVSASVRFARHHPIPVSAPQVPLSADVASLADRDFLSATSFMGRAA